MSLELRDAETAPAGVPLASTPHSRIAGHFRAAVATMPAALAAIYLQLTPPYEAMFFRGGWELLPYNLCHVVMFVYLAVFLIALGKLLIPKNPQPADYDDRLDIEVIRFFAAAGALVLIGFGLGAASLLRAWITAPLFCAVLYWYFLKHPGLARRCICWLTGRSHLTLEPRDVGTVFWITIVGVRATIVLLIGCLLLTKGIMLDVYGGDVMQMYFPYFAEIRHNHSIWIDPAHPLVFSFLIGRGNGVHLVFYKLHEPVCDSTHFARVSCRAWRRGASRAGPGIAPRE